MPYGDDPSQGGLGTYGSALPSGGTPGETPQPPTQGPGVNPGARQPGDGGPNGGGGLPQAPPAALAVPKVPGALDLDIENARKLKEQLDRERQGFGDRAAPNASAASINTANPDQMRAQQLQYLQQLQAAASGQAPSAAEIGGRLAQDRNVANQFGMAAALQGGNPGAALRQASMGAADINAQTAGQMMQLRAAEQATARGQLGGALEGVRSADSQQAQAQAALQQQTNLANMDAALKARGMDDAHRAELLKAMLESQGQGIQGGVAQGQQAAARDIATAGNRNALDIARLGNDTARRGQDQSQTNEIIGGIFGALGGIGGAALKSDARQKTNIVETPEEAGRMLEALRGVSYEYKDSTLPGTASGKRFGILAQDLEKSPMGASLVRETPHGKAIDVGQATGAVLAALAHLNQRVKKVERR